MRALFGMNLLLIALLFFSAPSWAENVILFENVRIFDGQGDQLSAPRNVLVRGNKIEKISAESIPFDRVTNLTLVKGGGRTLMPGLIAMHWHAMLVRPMPAELYLDSALQAV